MPDLTLSLLTWKQWLIILLIENYGMKKVNLMSCDVQYTPEAVPYSTLLDRILRSYCLVRFLFIMLSVALLSHKNVRPATVLALCSLTPWRLTGTTDKVYLFPIDKLKILVSNVESLLMASLCRYLFVFILLVTTWSNLFIAFLPAGRLCSYQSLSLDSDEL